jgi:hypothetical protein
MHTVQYVFFHRNLTAGGSSFKTKENPVLLILIRDPVPFWTLDPGSGMGKKPRSVYPEPG